MGGDAEQPGAELPLRVVLVEPIARSEERLVGGVLGVCAGSEQPLAEPQHVAMEVFEELPEGLGVAPLHFLHPATDRGLVQLASLRARSGCREVPPGAPAGRGGPAPAACGAEGGC